MLFPKEACLDVAHCEPRKCKRVGELHLSLSIVTFARVVVLGDGLSGGITMSQVVFSLRGLVHCKVWYTARFSILFTCDSV